MVAVTEFCTLKSNWRLVAVMSDFEEHLASREKSSRMKCSEEESSSIIQLLQPEKSRLAGSAELMEEDHQKH